MENFKIRRANLEDVSSLQELRNKHVKYEIEKFHNKLIDPNWPLSESSKKDFEWGINTQIIFVVEVENKIIAYIYGEILPKKSWDLYNVARVVNLFVVEEYRNKGIGGRLIESFIDECKNKGIENFKLSTDIKNQYAINFYKKYNFVESEVTMILEK